MTFFFANQVMDVTANSGGSRILVRGDQWSFDPRGEPEPTFAQNRGLSLKIA